MVIVFALDWVHLHCHEFVVGVLYLDEHLVVCFGETVQVTHELLVNGQLFGEDVIHLFYCHVHVIVVLRTKQLENFLVNVCGVDVLSQVQDDLLVNLCVFILRLGVALDTLVQLVPETSVELSDNTLVGVALHQWVV